VTNYRVTRYLLDTNVISELRKPRPHGAGVAWVSGLRPEQIFLSSVTLGELQIGVERLRWHDGQKASEIERWLDALQASMSVLPMDSACFREWARLIAGKPDNLLEDAMIASTARIHRLTVATRNVRDFADFMVEVANPFAPS
jgi:predicted nucleic acid-binding protein